MTPDSMDQQQDRKSELREIYRAKRRRLDPSDRNRASGQAVEYLERLNLPGEAKIVAGYCATDNEIEVEAFLFERGRGFELVLPKVLSKQEMGFFPVESRDELSPGFGGILEPDETPGAAVEASQIDIFLVPGLAFDVYGNRLGFGGGYYDRTLPCSTRKQAVDSLSECRESLSLTESNMPVRIGVCHDWQVRDKQLPVEAHDVPMDMLITDDKLYCSPELESK